MNAAVATVVRRNRRRVFGRMTNVRVDGEDWRFELTREGLVVRKKWARRARTIPLGTLAGLSEGQLPLAI